MEDLPQYLIMAARRAYVFFAVLILLYFLSNFYVKKSVFITEDGISVTFNLPRCFERESFYYSSLFVYANKSTLCVIPSSKTLILLLLLNCGDIESCPRPTQLESLLNSKGIKILYQNCCGLFKNIPNLTFLFSGQKNTVITLSEALIDSHSTYDDDSLYEIQGFSFIKKKDHDAIAYIR